MTVLTMAETASAVGLCYDRFRKHWRKLVAENGFPLPFWQTRKPRWDADAVAAWRTRASAAPLATAPTSDADRRRRADAELEALRGA